MVSVNFDIWGCEEVALGQVGRKELKSATQEYEKLINVYEN